jgi:hypothetical protein
MTRITIVLLTLLAMPACSKKHGNTDKLAQLCVQAGDDLARAASSSDNDSFESLLGTTIEACSQACDGDDQPSCTHLETHLHKLCNVAGDVCEKLCSTAQSPSLKDTSCKLATKKS